MMSSSNEDPTSTDAETILAAALKLLGIYMAFNGILNSGTFMSAMLPVAYMISNPSQMDAMQWGQFGTSLLGTVLAIGFAILLIQHGGRAAHWFAIRRDRELFIGDPTQKWYRGSALFIGVWILVTQFSGALFSLVWAVAQFFSPESLGGQIDTTKILALSTIHVAATLAVAFSLIFGARPIGDWLYRLAGGDRVPASASNTQ